MVMMIAKIMLSILSIISYMLANDKFCMNVIWVQNYFFDSDNQLGHILNPRCEITVETFPGRSL